ncbi:MAG: hypothetical protein R3F37_02025 [Candidatus Competibacteraceae bacterium]
MDFSITSGHPEKQRTACLVLGIMNPGACLQLPSNSTPPTTAT